jgi:hypothetical protein
MRRSLREMRDEVDEKVEPGQISMMVAAHVE